MKNPKRLVKLGVNIDHVATLRQARGGAEPDVFQAALEAIRGGADGITVHLREDRRHIQDSDVVRLLKERISVPLNLEMSVSPEIVKIACRLRPEKACLVPERRQELTTEGGLDIAASSRRIAEVVKELQDRGILVSLFVDPVSRQVQAAYEAGADSIELHTGAYANAKGKKQAEELARLRSSAELAVSLGLGLHAGHGLNYENVGPVAEFPDVRELNIGHSIVSRAVFVGLRSAAREMRELIRHAASH